ncbi:hypothetical protein B0F90DRAFT_1774621 [Multifurca ochricompacta]|uniref:Prolyl 4-hydroxylase alpha subunit Fe(2+) 2OG dioxygenase domain-containing protein n=1 Tax=Multifurca ochricompacta TaxID=376703 RepID=A0AAD4LV58_9AGAM|nr:hypothetical protein B0F90DRAFT_1774621 [Multifurca ochricompacta]
MSIRHEKKKKLFGSLVIVFPTAHEGGTLHLRHRGQEGIFDSGLELAKLRTPTIGYIAFFSDIEHEVAPGLLLRRIQVRKAALTHQLQ